MNESRLKIVVATERERERLASGLNESLSIDVIGFGPIAAAVSTCRILATHSVTRVVLVGIAGSYDSSLAVGTACQFASVHSDGIGAGEGKDFISADQMGFSQLATFSHLPQGAEVLPLTTDAGVPARSSVVTVCSAAMDSNQVEKRGERFPDAVAEDMEGFGVALACAAFQVPCSIVRGISNVAGDRNKENWRIDAAMESASRVLNQILAASK